eukprot:SM000180S03489  [mRNA]  locus=s180:36955:38891:- [translate_table: standard]
MVLFRQVSRRLSGVDELLTPEEDAAKVRELRATLGPLDEKQTIYCTDGCLRRYLKARNWNVKKAEKMLRDTLKWRQKYKPEEIKWEDVAHEGETAKLYKADFLDRKGHSVLVMCPGRQNTNEHNSQMRHLVYCLENAVISLPPDQEQMVWLVDFQGWTYRSSPPMKSARETLNILQNHYPERLGLAICYNPPRVFEAFWSMIRPFIDSKTAKKVRFIYAKGSQSTRLLEELFDLDKLDQQFGGKKPWSYDHEAYSKLRKQDDLKQAEHWHLPLVGRGLQEQAGGVANEGKGYYANGHASITT